MPAVHTIEGPQDEDLRPGGDRLGGCTSLDTHGVRTCRGMLFTCQPAPSAHAATLPP